MPLPRPVPGLVLRYSYLWREEYLKGLEEGRKDRPCAVILVVEDESGRQVVTVLPVTHSPPSDPSQALEIPVETKRRLGLDDERSWVVMTQANQFAWPGPDLRPAKPGEAGSVAYGHLPRTFFEHLRKRFVTMVKARRVGLVGRS